MPGAKIGKNVTIEKAVIGPDAIIEDGAKIGLTESDNNPYASPLCTHDIVLIAGGVTVPKDSDIPKNSMLDA